MTIDTLQAHTIALLKWAVAHLERRVPQPRIVLMNGHPVARYAERLPQQAAVQKLARVGSGILALDHLRRAGLFQEQCVLQRILDELSEDITLIGVGLTDSEVRPLLDRYLDAFWQEELTGSSFLNSSLDRPLIPRKKIRAALNRSIPYPDKSLMDSVGKAIHKVYSGFVHGASPQVMEMYSIEENCFRVDGYADSPLAHGHNDDSLNYAYRAIMAAMMVCSITGSHDLFEEIDAFKLRFEQEAGLDNLIKVPPGA